MYFSPGAPLPPPCVEVLLVCQSGSLLTVWGNLIERRWGHRPGKGVGGIPQVRPPPPSPQPSSFGSAFAQPPIDGIAAFCCLALFAGSSLPLSRECLWPLLVFICFVLGLCLVVLRGFSWLCA